MLRESVAYPVVSGVVFHVNSNLSRDGRQPIVLDIVTPPLLLGETELGETLRITPDSTPELVFSFPGAPPASIQLQHTDGTTYGPFTVVGTGAQVTTNLPDGVYSVVGQAANSEGDLVPIGGTITIVTDVYNDTYNEVYA